MKTVSTIALLLVISVTPAAKTSNRQIMLSIHKDLDVMCRGGHGDQPETQQACDVRNKVDALLRTHANGQTKSDLSLSIYKDLNAMCRGGHGDQPETQQACDVRNKVSTLLRNMGYCWKATWWKKCRS